MILWFMLVFLKPATCAIMGNRPICPGVSSVSVLIPSANKSTPECDLCDKLKPMGAKFVTDCYRISKSGSIAQLQWFTDVINLVWGGVVIPNKPIKKFDIPLCECDPCAELAKASKPFMKECAPQMTHDMVSERLRTCRRVKQDQEELWLFYQDLKAECYALTGENITFSFCACDVCWLLFYETSDFMTKCGNHMDQAMVNKLFSSCEKIVCDPVELWYFKKDLQLICEKKLNVTFEFPECGCEECWLLFQKESDFMQKCGIEMSDDMLRTLMKDCYANLHNLENFMTFIDNLQLACQNKGKGHFKQEWCYCIDCLLFEDHENEVWKDCIKHMPESMRLEKRKSCFDAVLQNDLFGFITELLNFCNTSFGTNVTFPSCDGCTRTDLSYVFAMDCSPSIRKHNYTDTVTVLFTDLIDHSIGPNKTHIGLIRFDSEAHMMFNLKPGYFTEGNIGFYLMTRLYYHYGEGTEIAPVLEMIGTMFRDIHDNRTKYAIVITDGYNGGFSQNTIEEALDTIPGDVTMLVVGVGYTDVQTLLEVARNKPQNVYNYNPKPLLKDIYLIVGDLMRSIGC